MKPQVLLIGGTDSSCGAGITADFEVISELGGDCLSCVTSVTAQNNHSFLKSHAIPASMIEEQLNSFQEQKIDAVKIGMLPTSESVEVVVEFIQKFSLQNIVIDPVFRSSSEGVLSSESAIEAVQKKLLRLCSLVTPNLSEAIHLTGLNYCHFDDFPKFANQFFLMGSNAVLIKGGHLDDQNCKDFFATLDGNSVTFEHKRVRGGTAIRGTGCRLASAIVYHLARSVEMESAIELGVNFLQEYIQRKLVQVN